MDIDKIMAVPGMSGLFRTISKTKNGFVVESLADQKRSVVNASQRISLLKEITVYKADGNISLLEIFRIIREKNGDSLPVNPKSEPSELKKYFKTIVPDYDEERVYASDIKKIISWYGLLKDYSFEEAKPEESNTDLTTESDATELPDKSQPEK